MLTAVSDSTTIPQALQNTGIGMGTVFVVLVLISFIISLFKFIPMLMEHIKERQGIREQKAAREKQAARAAAAPARPPAPERVTRPMTGSVAASAADRQVLVAVIAAAIAAQMTEETGVPVQADGLVIRSIKKRTLSN